MKRSEIAFGIIKIPVDFIMTFAAFIAAYELRLITEPISWISKPIDYSVLPTQIEYIYFSITVAIALVAVFALGKMYNLKTTHKFSKETKRVVTLCGIWIMLIITYFFFTRTFPFSRLAIIYSWTLTFILVIAGRAFIKLIQNAFLRAGIGKRRLLFIGNNSVTNELSKNLNFDLS